MASIIPEVLNHFNNGLIFKRKDYLIAVINIIAVHLVNKWSDFQKVKAK